MKTKLLLGPFVVLILSVTPQGARGQAAAEYGLTSASSATSTSSLAKVYSHALDKTVSGKIDHIDHPGAKTVVHNTPSAGSKAKATNKQNGRSTVATVTDHGSSQAGHIVSAPPAASDSFKMKIYGAESTEVKAPPQ
ncbi:septal ring lytic transglycosylase RlpA family protein [Edaphobacter bradus]|uniref:septal ring lytic transglycosylase RlpA family protein n=1 Tax=Edaphobacter bradus TaxID=2259016 RepID=UPI0021DF5259|nr:septal ring lytic transglycosylase RlpA family protein [Edaphobacter bradus]